MTLFICKFFDNLKQFFFNEIPVKGNFHNNYITVTFRKHKREFITIDYNFEIITKFMLIRKNCLPKIKT